jgi:hypothetical protein
MCVPLTWRGRLVAYGARLESVFTRKGIEGSNPSPSARIKKFLLEYFYPAGI